MVCADSRDTDIIAMKIVRFNILFYLVLIFISIQMLKDIFIYNSHNSKMPYMSYKRTKIINTKYLLRTYGFIRKNFVNF